MLNLDQLLKSAPAMPTTSGRWASVYLEPMIGSGERLTVAVATITSSGEILVKPAIRKAFLIAGLTKISPDDVIVATATVSRSPEPIIGSR